MNFWPFSLLFSLLFSVLFSVLFCVGLVFGLIFGLKPKRGEGVARRDGYIVLYMHCAVGVTRKGCLP